MNEYVHEWAMQRERECRGSANGGGAVANACMARGCMVWRVVEGSAGLMADWLVCFASENRVMSRVVWCVGASCVVVEAHVQTDRHVDGWLAWPLS